MTKGLFRIFVSCLFFLPALCCLAEQKEVILTQVVSREHPSFDVPGSRMTVGGDGRVYLGNGGSPNGYVLRMNADGTERFGGKTTPAFANVAVNKDGIVATANPHFTHAVNLWDVDLLQIGGVNDFLNNDAMEWFGPCDVQAGANDFYGMDENRDRIVRVSVPGKIVTTYSLAGTGVSYVRDLLRFRVWEAGERFFLTNKQGDIIALGFDGKKQWTAPAGVGGNPWEGYAGVFDVAADGKMYVLKANSDTLKIYNTDGQPDGEIKLQMAERTGKYNDLRIFGNTIFLKRPHPMELFQVYNKTTGEFIRVVNADAEQLKVTLASDTWTAGQPTPLTINFDTGGRVIAPHWRVWLRPYTRANFIELPLVDGKVTPPADAAGLYQLRVSPGVHGSNAEYIVQTLLEIRKAESKGTINVYTPLNRVFYGQGEEIPATVLVRAADADTPKKVTLRLFDDTQTVLTQELALEADKTAKYSLPAAVTKSLKPGNYQLQVSIAGLTGVAQHLVIGPGFTHASPFFFVQHGDYGMTRPQGDLWNEPEILASHLTRSAKLGTNLFIDRITDYRFSINVANWGGTSQTVINSLADRLQADPLATAAEKARPESPGAQTVAGYSAAGMHFMGILLGMDAGLPLGTLWSPRPADKLVEDIQNFTPPLLQYPAFRGWSWVANWWPAKFGADAADNDEQMQAYLAALKTANETGTWNPILDIVSDNWMKLPGEAINLFNTTLDNVKPGLVKAAAGPYRSVMTYPPLTLRYLDEIDLHYQAEQIAPPQAFPHNVDYQTRPGKPSWAHPELWNDGGTGDYIMPTFFQMIMRGVSGVGNSGMIPAWGQQTEDNRSTAAGTVSVFRALQLITRPYGPWLTTLQKRDPVAIVVSGRMIRIDNWKNIGGGHFDRMYDAYNSCLYAHYPASFVFTEDLQPTTLAQYKIILVVDQRVEFEPTLLAALQAAKKAGAAIYADGSCRPELVKDFTPLDITFDRVANDPSAWQDDSAYQRFPEYFKAGAKVLVNAFTAATPPIAQVANPEIMLSERISGNGRYLWVVNNTPTGLDPGVIWRVSIAMANRIPLVTPLTLQNVQGKAIYDVFALKQVTPTNGTLQVDLRSLPARLYAILPAAIGKVSLTGAKSVIAGQAISWSAQLQDAAGKALQTNIPLRIRIIAENGEILDEQFRTTSAAQGISGSSIIPLNTSAALCSLTVTEMLSGKQASLPVRIIKPGGQLTPGQANISGTEVTKSLIPAENGFGPHLRDIAISPDGGQALINAMNWDHNLYAIDTANGALRWRERVGQHFAYAPQAVGNDFAVQGFDLQSTEGYHLYLMKKDGAVERRFALYGVPKRVSSWASAASQLGRINNFATATDGAWVATAGDLGLAVWSRDGKLLWSQDWWKTTRHSAALLSPNAATLLSMTGMTATSFEALTGKQNWQLTFAKMGEILDGAASKDGKTLAFRASTEGGRIYIVRDGALLTTLFTAADALSLAPDGSALAVTINNQLKWYSVASGLQWSFEGDDIMRFPRISPDSKRLAVSSELGTSYVFSAAGDLLWAKDSGVLTVPGWLPDGDLLLATWMGTVCRLDSKFVEKWRVRLQPAETDIREKLLVADKTPTVRMSNWGNAAATPAPLTPNLLKDTNALIYITLNDQARELKNPIDMLRDGEAVIPEKPWLDWTTINYIDSGWCGPMKICFDTFRTQIKLTGITFVEDPAHAESWLRDMQLQYWDAANEKWLDGPMLLSNSATHTHWFEKPIEASRFRLVSTAYPGTWPAGNIRLGEVVFHGEQLGGSNPDVVAKRPLAVLFDEQEIDLKVMQSPQFIFKYDDAYSGGKSLALKDAGGATPVYQPPFGHAIPNWDFEIVENPQPGQYRWLQFAWKALSPNTTGMALLIGRNFPGGGYNFVAGTHDWGQGVIAQKIVTATPPADWQVVRVDLWTMYQQPMRLQCLQLAAVGGGAAFDQIVLGRTEGDLPVKK